MGFDMRILEYSQSNRPNDERYFRLALEAMHTTLEAMDNLGMLANVAPPPKPDLVILGYDGPCVFEAALNDATPQAAREAIEDWLAAPPSVPGMARYKFVSNDYWVVTPQEITSALVRLDGQPEPDLWWWNDWVGFLRRAADYGGFEVS